jgi:hypothetical protein
LSNIRVTFFERFKQGNELWLKPGKRIFEGLNYSGYDQKHTIKDSIPGTLRLNSLNFGQSGRRKFTIVDWDGDGSMVSYTYNDYVMEQLAKTNPQVKDLRTIGLMFPKKVQVPNTANVENNNGEMFALLAARVTENPKPGSDEIDKAFDECWIGKEGYLKADGRRQRKAIAYQGNVRDEQGSTVTEIFVADIPDYLTATTFDESIAGTNNTRPAVPQGIGQRRVTFSNFFNRFCITTNFGK